MAFVRIPTFNAGEIVVDGQGRFTASTLRTLNATLQQLAQAINAIAALPEIQQALADAQTLIGTVQDAAAAANTAAANAQNAADATTSATALANSYIDNPAPIEVIDDGASVTVNVAAHNRIYGDGTSVAVDAGSIDGLPYNTGQYIFYSDPARTGGAVAYQATTDPLDVAQRGAIHSVGYAPPLSSGTPNTPGGGIRPPGGSYYSPDL